ncbi:unnamed protein product, partial [Effrenium voratum]
DGMPNTRAIETSKGIIRIPFPLTLFAASVPGTVVSLGWLLVFAGVLAFLPFIVMITSPEGAKWVAWLSSTAVVESGTRIPRRIRRPAELGFEATCNPSGNNQWQIEEELGAGWHLGGDSVGTAMILDDEALPLTRAWCLFEVLQTKIIRTTRENFRGLYLCTITGVLQNGKSGVDLPMRIAERLASLRLENATASDKEMIGELVSKMPGGFQAMNHFLRRNISEALRTMQARGRLAKVWADIPCFTPVRKSQARLWPPHDHSTFPFPQLPYFFFASFRASESCAKQRIQPRRKLPGTLKCCRQCSPPNWRHYCTSWTTQSSKASKARS